MVFQTSAFKNSNILHNSNNSQSNIQHSNEHIEKLQLATNSLRQSKELFKAKCQELISNSTIQLKDFEMLKFQLSQRIIKLKMSRLESNE